MLYQLSYVRNRRGCQQCIAGTVRPGDASSAPSGTARG
ncbi:MAG: hypothetical protein QOE87_3093 [Gaiellales bacterium]|nr:hypothetical protein [Gaiellales bacterium]